MIIKKLTRVIKYLCGTVAMPLTLEASNTQIMQWWVDALYSVHHDMKSHTGGVVSLRKGAIYATSTWQKLNGISYLLRAFQKFYI